MKRALERIGTPLVFYYAFTLGVPLANGAEGAVFREHARVVFFVPLALMILYATIRCAVRLLLFRHNRSGGITESHVPTGL